MTIKETTARGLEAGREDGSEMVTNRRIQECGAGTGIIEWDDKGYPTLASLQQLQEALEDKEEPSLRKLSSQTARQTTPEEVQIKKTRIMLEKMTQGEGLYTAKAISTIVADIATRKPEPEPEAAKAKESRRKHTRRSREEQPK